MHDTDITTLPFKSAVPVISFACTASCVGKAEEAHEPTSRRCPLLLALIGPEAVHGTSRLPLRLSLMELEAFHRTTRLWYRAVLERPTVCIRGLRDRNTCYIVCVCWGSIAFATVCEICCLARCFRQICFARCRSQTSSQLPTGPEVKTECFPSV